MEQGDASVPRIGRAQLAVVYDFMYTDVWRSHTLSLPLDILAVRALGTMETKGVFRYQTFSHHPVLLLSFPSYINVSEKRNLLR